MKINNREVNEIGKYIYMDNFHKMYILNTKRDGYLMLNMKQQKQFQFFRFRFVISMLAGFLLYYYVSISYISIIFGVSVFMVLHLIYRYIFLSTLTEVKGVIKKEKGGWKDNFLKASNSSLIKLTILSLVICVLFIYNFIDLFLLNNQIVLKDFERLVSLFLYLLMIIGSGSVSILSLYYLMKKRKVK